MFTLLHQVLHRLPLTIKMVFITILVGLTVWGVMDRLVSNAVKSMFEAQLSEKLKQQSQEDRLRFDHYLEAFHQVGSLIMTQNKFIEYLEENRWFSEYDKQLQVFHRYPPWFLSVSALRVLAIPRYAVVLDDLGRTRAVYHKKQDVLPEALRNPAEYILRKSLDLTHIATVDNLPYLFTSKTVVSPQGNKVTLVLASPADDELLVVSQRDYPNRLVGMISDDNQTILTSNNPELIPPGTELETLQDRYVVESRPMHDYGGSEVPIKFTSFISKGNIEEMQETFAVKGSHYRAITAVVFIFSFACIMLWITKRISRLTGRVEAFSREALGGMGQETGHGDALNVLENRFSKLTQEVNESHRIIHEKAAIKAEMEQKERLFELLRYVMDFLGIGILIRKEDGLHAANSTMELFQDRCGGSGAFDIQDSMNEERVIHDSDNNHRVFHLTSPVIPTGENVILVRDITDQKKLEDQLHHAKKMESVGQLAGGIAHDFNNFLTAIVGYGNIIKMKLKKEDPLRAHVTQILASSERAADLTRSLLMFSRKQVINPKPVDLNDIVRRSEMLASRLIHADIKLETILFGKDLIVKADSGQIEQVILNLASNARDAMPAGGSLTIETGLIDMDKDLTNTRACGEPGTYALMSISDSGIGLDKEIKEKIFEPFFTTKEVGKGTGLGLAMVYGIVKQHNGCINVYSEPGTGTTFKIYLPLISAVPVAEAQEDLSPVKGGTETILVAEDDPDVAKLIKSILKESGYKVISAENGEAAVNAYHKNRDSINLLLLDVIMPGKNGKEVYTEIQEISPGIKALFVSGYTADLIQKKGMLEEGLHFIPKPVTVNDLLRKVRAVLDE